MALEQKERARSGSLEAAAAVAAIVAILAVAGSIRGSVGVALTQDARAQDERRENKAPGNGGNAVAPVGSPAPTALANAREAAPVSTPTGGMAVIISTTESAEKAPKEWRWYYKQVNGEFHIVLDRATNTYRFEVIKSHRVKPEKAPKGKISGDFPTTEEAARLEVIKAIAKWEKTTPEERENALTSGFWVKTGKEIFRRVVQ